MENKFKYSNSNKRYHTLDYFYKNKFNSKVFKVSLNAGFSMEDVYIVHHLVVVIMQEIQMII